MAPARLKLWRGEWDSNPPEKRELKDSQRTGIGGYNSRRQEWRFMNQPESVAPSIAAIANLGQPKKEISVGLSTRFLEHFSEQLYSSPNKAFEELLANSWDANARSAYVYLPMDSTLPDAAIYVLDDGDSMNDDGLEDLWQIASSKKIELQSTSTGRAMIGKFGIGKLATYVLANQLTYICKATDGIIRAVTMDYGSLDSGHHDLIGQLKLKIREVSEKELKQLLETTTDGKIVYGLIQKHIPAPKADTEWDDEFAAAKAPPPQPKGTWTLVVLSSLKPRGKDIKRGIVRRMIQSALPLGAELKIVLNGEHLASTKSALSTISDWVIGPSLAIDQIALPPREGAEPDEESEKIKVQSLTSPYPHVEIAGIGKITGRIRLYQDRISGGKSEEHGPSNGFFVNVRGRVTNNDPHFGEKDLSHSAWSRFRMTVRADGLNDLLSVNREQFTDRKELRIFKAFLRACFNKARTEWEKQDKWADSGAAIVESYGILPLMSFRNYVEDLVSEPPVGGSTLVDIDGAKDVTKALTDYRDVTKNDLRSVLTSVEFEDLGDKAPSLRYSLQSRKLLINRNHPFVKEHSEDSAQKSTLKDTFLIDLLTDVHAYEIGIEPAQIEELRQRRDRIARLVAKIHRKSGAQIASLLLEVSKHPDYRALEIVVGDALEFLGLDVTRIGGSDEPEGVAKAKLPPGPGGLAQAFSFTYDAKSSKHGKAQTGNCNVAGLVRHKDKYQVDHILLVGPDFQAGALDDECEKNGVTPMRAADLGKLLVLTAEFGAIPLTKLREVFELTSPEAVSTWVQGLAAWLKGKRKLTFADFIGTLATLEEDFPDIVSVSVLADRCRKFTGKQDITEVEIRRLVTGVQIVIPDLVQIENDKIVVSAHPNKLADAMNSQLQKIKQLEVDGTTKAN
jgi:hypothetical protein